MGRILFWVILIVAIYAAFVFARSRRSKEGVHKQVGGKKSKFPTAMIECPECGAYFPEDEAVLGDGKAYCSERCRKKARSKSPHAGYMAHRHRVFSSRRVLLALFADVVGIRPCGQPRKRL